MLERTQKEYGSRKNIELKETEIEIEMHMNKGNVITKCNVCIESV